MSQSYDRFFNRELSWLEFNQRVLDEAADSGVPALERLKFLAITGSNLDEFTMVRLGGLKLMVADGTTQRGPAGFTPGQMVEAVRKRMRRMVADQYACLGGLEEVLSRAGIHRVRPAELLAGQREHLRSVFNSEISAIVTPMALDPGEECPLLANLALYLLVRLAPAQDGDAPRYALVPMGGTLRRFVPVPGAEGYTYALAEDVIRHCIADLFPGVPVEECVAFRITRNADISVHDEFSPDLLNEMVEILQARRRGACIRLEVEDKCSDLCLTFLERLLDVEPADVFRAAGPLNVAAFMSLSSLNGYDDLRYESWPPLASPEVDPGESIFEQLADHPVLLLHPFESFDPVVKLVEEAARDERVLAIKQILYRTSRRSPIVAALKHAAANGKHVTALVELKARFDEARNIEWARELEQAGVQVIYGVRGLKTHAKVCIVVRREDRGIVKYVHFGTGNYNETTARLYTDVSYMTCDRELGNDATAFFNAISGYSEPRRYAKLDAAPVSLRTRILEMIQVEIERKRQGQEAGIMIKLNSLVDPDVIESLYTASAAGVPVKLNIRGICCIKPGVPGLSDNITVVSIVDRYLEHSRILYFHHGGDPRVYISSADWMPRNLDRRIELLVPIEDESARRRLIEVIETCMADPVKGRRLLPTGVYARASGGRRAKAVGSQRALYLAARARVETQRQAGRTFFKPHRPRHDENTDTRG